MFMGAALLIPASPIVDRPWTLQPSVASLAALLALAVFSTALAFVIYFRLIRTIGPVATTAQAYLRVPIGVAAGVLFLDESLTPAAWVGLACVITGVAAMTLPSARRKSRITPISRGEVLATPRSGGWRRGRAARSRNREMAQRC